MSDQDAPVIPFGPFDHETTVDFEKGRVEELMGLIFILEIENGTEPSEALKRLIDRTARRLKSVRDNLNRISTPARMN